MFRAIAFAVALLASTAAFAQSGKVTVITPVEGSPAARLGIRAGDIIYRVE